MSNKWKVTRSIDEMKSFYQELIEPLKEVARSHGYALAVHGSMTRDFDLIAVPWSLNCSDRNTLARDLQSKACGFFMDKYSWEKKPGLRFATMFPVCFIDYKTLTDNRAGLGHIDLSVIDYKDCDDVKEIERLEKENTELKMSLTQQGFYLEDRLFHIHQLNEQLKKKDQIIEKAEKLLKKHNDFLYKTSMVFSSSTAFDLCQEFEQYKEQFQDKDKE